MSTSENGASAEHVVDAPGNGGPPEPPLRLGGRGRRNGLLIHGPTAWAAAARAPDGGIEVASGPKPTFARGPLGTLPLLRGPLRLAEAVGVLPIPGCSPPS